MSMSGIKLRQWDSTPNNQEKFKIVTKFTDLGNPDSKTQKKMGVFNTFAYNIKIEYDNRNLLNTYVYQRVEGFTDQEVVDIMKKHLDIKRGLSENIVIPSSICTGYECLSSPLRGKLDV